jgi:transposase InsO family protein
MEIKTDNGQACTSKAFQRFCMKFAIVLKTGIPYNPQGQRIVEKVNGLLKAHLKKLKRETWGFKDTPNFLLSHTLFTLNF